METFCTVWMKGITRSHLCNISLRRLGSRSHCGWRRQLFQAVADRIQLLMSGGYFKWLQSYWQSLFMTQFDLHRCKSQLTADVLIIIIVYDPVSQQPTGVVQQPLRLTIKSDDGQNHVWFMITMHVQHDWPHHTHFTDRYHVCGKCVWEIAIGQAQWKSYLSSGIISNGEILNSEGL